MAYLLVHIHVGCNLIWDLSRINLCPDLVHGLHGLLTLDSPGIGEFCSPGDISWDEGPSELVYGSIRDRFDVFLFVEGSRVHLVVSLFDLDNALVMMTLRVRDTQ